MADPIRYDRLYQYAQENRLDYNELCRVVRVAAAPAIKDSMRYRWLTEHAHVAEQRIEELRSFRYNGKPAYEVRALGVIPDGVIASDGSRAE